MTNLNTVTRRSFLRTTVAASAVAVPAAAIAAPMGQGTIAASAENPDLLAAHKAVVAADAELKAARDALEWLVDEYRHLWPLAPEALLRGANAHTYTQEGTRIETDIAGRPLFREKALLTTRLSAKSRREGGTTCFALDTAADLTERLQSLRSKKVTGRTPRALERNRARVEGWRRQYETALQLAIQYETETARLRSVSGVGAVKARFSAAKREHAAAVDALCKQTAFTAAGVARKVEAIRNLAPNIFKSQFAANGSPLSAMMNTLVNISVPQA